MNHVQTLKAREPVDGTAYHARKVGQHREAFYSRSKCLLSYVGRQRQHHIAPHAINPHALAVVFIQAQRIILRQPNKSRLVYNTRVCKCCCRRSDPP
jgi:hypothetical protein